MIDNMRMRKLAPGTRSGYIRVVRQFTAFLRRPLDSANVEDLRRYQLHLVDHGISPVSLNAAITGLKFFFEVTLNQAERLCQLVELRRTDGRKEHPQKTSDGFWATVVMSHHDTNRAASSLR
ncbi:phage integrase N-terminal SAM-like domain-containing protein [Paraburkholderia metrosideri]|uniref:phage integrase N-terminal SAM-like domain-containing protein n=1 Tax=Paraburkholderia metrosideri TaxID=580937 RepID=UPI0038BB720A